MATMPGMATAHAAEKLPKNVITTAETELAEDTAQIGVAKDIFLRIVLVESRIAKLIVLLLLLWI